MEDCWIGKSQSTHCISNAHDWRGAAQSFCRSLSGVICGGREWGIALHICDLIFPFGVMTLPQGGRGENYSAVQQELIDIWRKCGLTGTAESAVSAMERMVCVGGPAAAR